MNANPKEMSTQPSEQQSSHEQQSLPEEMLFLFDVGRFAHMTEQIAELSAQLTPQMREAAEKLSAKSMEMVAHGKQGVRKILEGIKFPAPFDLLKGLKVSEKKTVQTLVALLLIFSFVVSACGFPVDAAPLPTNSTLTAQTEITTMPTEQASSTLTVTEPSSTPTFEASPTPEPTATVESGLHFELPPMTLDNIQIPDIAKNQFPIETTARPDGSTSRQVFCVSDGLYVGRIQLSENIHALVSAECWYEENGERRSFYLPLAWTDEKIIFTVGYIPTEYDPGYEEGVEAFWMSFLSPAGYTGNGHIFIVSAEQIDPNLGVYGTFQGVGAEELAKIYTEGLFAKFGNTGDPETLGGVMVSPDVGMVNTRNN